MCFFATIPTGEWQKPIVFLVLSFTIVWIIRRNDALPYTTSNISTGAGNAASCYSFRSGDDTKRTIQTKMPGGKITNFTLCIYDTWCQASPEVMLDAKMILHEQKMVMLDSGNPQRYHSFQLLMLPLSFIFSPDKASQ